MSVTFIYDPAMEQAPLKSGMGGQNPTTSTELALRAIRVDVNYLDKDAVEHWVKQVIRKDGLNLENDTNRI